MLIWDLTNPMLMSLDNNRSTRRTVLRRVSAGAVSLGALVGVSSAANESDFGPAGRPDIEIDYLAAEPSLLKSGEETDFIMDVSGDDWEDSVLRVKRCGPDDWQCEDTTTVDRWYSQVKYDVSYQEPGFYELMGAGLDETGSGIPAYRHFWVDDGSYGTLPEPVVSGPSTVSTGAEVTFDLHSSSMQYGDITDHRWYVDGELDWGETGPTFDVVFNEPGTHTVAGGVEGTIQSDYGPYDLNNDLVSGIHKDVMEVTVTD